MKLPFVKEAVYNVFTKPSTIAFPKEASPAKENYRGRILYDPEKCVNCGACVKVCSPGAITVTKEKVKDGTIVTYEFDLTSCTFCGTCEDFCESHAIHQSADYHMIAVAGEELVVRGSSFKKDVSGTLAIDENCIYCGLCAKKCPEEAITVDRPNKTWSVDVSKCVKCGQCISKCPKKALDFREE